MIAILAHHKIEKKKTLGACVYEEKTIVNFYMYLGLKKG
jgi:hypothetical protein